MPMSKNDASDKRLELLKLAEVAILNGANNEMKLAQGRLYMELAELYQPTRMPGHRADI